MIWLVGASGMLGKQVALELKCRNLDFVSTDREVDITNLDGIREFSKGLKLSALINCSAYTAVDKAEDEEALCSRINVDGVKKLGILAHELGAPVIHVSTDYVFDGNGSEPYREDQEIKPQGVYGKTKAEGERLLLEVNPNSTIIRTAWLYGIYGPNFVTTMIKLMKVKPDLGVVADQKGTPTYAVDLAEVLVEVATRESWEPGIYHFTNLGETNWYDFALEIQKQALENGLLFMPTPLKPLTTEQYPTKAKRPSYSVLDKTKITKALGKPPREWKVALGIYMKELQ